jgi:HTH-type transcriptional regulator / antitoxin HigA
VANYIAFLLVIKDRNDLSQDESDYLNVLGTLAYEYEDNQELVPDIYGVEEIDVAFKSN